MAWVEADMTALRAAIKSGVLTVSFDGPPRRMITYQSLPAMRELLAEMERDVNGTTSYRVAQVRKGV